MRWFGVSKCDPRALALADRHYSRQKPGSKEIGPPGQKIIVMTADGRALWGSHRPAPWSEVKRQDGFEGHSCFIFRNEGEERSSTLIREAVGVTAAMWGDASFITYIGIDHVEAKDEPGYCYLRARFRHDGWVRSSKLGWLRRLVMPESTVRRCRLELV